MTDPTRNQQGGVPMSDAQGPVPPRIARGDRLDELRLEHDADQIAKVAHGLPVDHDLPPQMVGETTGAEPDPPHGDVREVANAPSIWEAREDGPKVRAVPGEAAEDIRARAQAETPTAPPLGADVSRIGDG